MTDKRAPETIPPSDDGVDPGEPVAELFGLEAVASSKFLPSLIHKIDRRLLTVDLFELIRTGIREIFIEYWSMVTSVLGDRKPKKPETKS